MTAASTAVAYQRRREREELLYLADLQRHANTSWRSRGENVSGISSGAYGVIKRRLYPSQCVASLSMASMAICVAMANRGMWRMAAAIMAVAIAWRIMWQYPAARRCVAQAGNGGALRSSSYVAVYVYHGVISSSAVAMANGVWQQRLSAAWRQHIGGSIAFSVCGIAVT